MTSTDLLTSREMVVSLANTQRPSSSSRRMQITIVVDGKSSKRIEFLENNDQNSRAQRAFFNVTAIVPRIGFTKNSIIFPTSRNEESAGTLSHSGRLAGHEEVERRFIVIKLLLA